MRTVAPLSLTLLVLTGLAGFSQPAGKALPKLPEPPRELAQPPADGAKTPSGLVTRVLRHGQPGAHPRPQDYVTFHYTGWTLDGRSFDSTLALDGPLTLPLERLMKGMVEGMGLMTAGEKRLLWVPEALAFAGAKGKPAGNLVLEVDLLAVDPPPSEAPADLTRPPEEALLRPSGLVFRSLRAGTGTQHPTKRSTVTVHYSGWTQDGKLFDSSVLRRSPATFRLDGVIKGWTEGVQLMVKGDKFRFWVPQKLAYQGEEGKPAGLLVFDIELQEFWQ